jgi:hypothetical protein
MFKNEINDVVICQDQSSAARPYYTLIAVKDRETAKTLLSIFERNPRDVDEPAYIKCFSHNEQLCYLFPYHVERNLESFAEGQGINQVIRESICINLVLACLSSPLPFPLLYLILNQKQMHIEKDNSIFFTYCLDLSELDATKDEAGCTVRCVNILLNILQEQSRKPLKSFDLLRKKIDSRSYRQLTELYRDIRISALPEKKSKFFNRFRSFWGRHKDVFFRILLVVSIVSAAFALLMLLSYLIFGDFALFRLFGGSIDKIGTEVINIK